MSEELEARLTALITKLESRLALMDHLDDRVAQVAETERKLTNLALKLSATRFMISWIPGAIAGAIAGATATLALFGIHGHP